MIKYCMRGMKIRRKLPELNSLSKLRQQKCILKKFAKLLFTFLPVKVYKIETHKKCFSMT